MNIPFDLDRPTPVHDLDDVLARVTDTEPPLRVICCFCPGWTRADPANRGASHGICPTCSARLHAEMDALGWVA